jgi:hypothetical protein
MHFARSEIDTPLKVSSIFGVISGVLLLSSLLAFNLKLGPVDYSSLVTSSSGYSSPLTLPSLIIASTIDGLFVIFGGLTVLFARMNIERRGVLAFFVFISSLIGTIGSLFFLGLVFLGPQ